MTKRTLDASIAGTPVRRVALDTLKHDPHNPRVHPADNLLLLRKSLERFGQPEALVVQKATGIVISGNGRLEAMQALGWKTARVQEVDWDDTKARAYSVIANRSTELGRWDPAALDLAYDELRAEGYDILDLGFTEATLEEAVTDLHRLRVALDTDAPSVEDDGYDFPGVDPAPTDVALNTAASDGGAPSGPRGAVVDTIVPAPPAPSAGQRLAEAVVAASRPWEDDGGGQVVEGLVPAQWYAVEGARLFVVAVWVPLRVADPYDTQGLVLYYAGRREDRFEVWMGTKAGRKPALTALSAETLLDLAARLGEL